MEILTPPDPVDELNFQYKIQRKLKVFVEANLPNGPCNLIASSSKYGLIFIGTPTNKLLVYHTRELIDKNKNDIPALTLQLNETPIYLALNCDQEYLAVSCAKALYFYYIPAFQSENCNPIKKCVLTKLSPSGVISCIQWNPCINNILAVCCSDGTLAICTLTESGVDVNEISAKARCLCWSVKGKQVVTGNTDGTLTPYKPDLTLMKTIPAPNLFNGHAVCVLAVHWLSNYQFAAVYNDVNNKDSRPCVVIVNAPKSPPVRYVNHDDICYSMGTNRPWYYYISSIPQWNALMVSSSNSMEIATLGSADASNWIQWTQMDEARPELPLTDKKQENYPVGLTFDTAALHQLPWGENETLAPMPSLYILSHTGMLTIFNVINLKQDAPNICQPPTIYNLCNKYMMIQDVKPQESQKPLSGSPETQQQQPATFPSSQPVVVKVPTTAPTSQPTFAPKPPGFVQAKPGEIAQPQPVISSAFSLTQQSAQIPQVKSVVPFGIPFGLSQSSDKGTTILPTATTKIEDTVKPIQQKPAPSKEQAAPQLQQKSEPVPEVKVKSSAELNEQLRNVLLQEVNSFQKNLHSFLKKMQSINVNLEKADELHEISMKLASLNAKELETACDLDNLRDSIAQIKLELVKTCAVVAQARSRPNQHELEELNQVDPLTSKRLNSIKKLVYYVQNQLEQANRTLDERWEKYDSRGNVSGKSMTMPGLDEIYQPLVRQQEVLTRQQALIRSMKKTISDANLLPSTPKIIKKSTLQKDPLAKLTKNILNMSMDPANNLKSPIDPSKLDRLRDLLMNHKTIRIKPVNIESSELKRHLNSLKKKHETVRMESPKKPIQPQVIISDRRTEQPAPYKADTQITSVPQLPRMEVKPVTDINAKDVPIPEQFINETKPLQQSPVSVPTFNVTPAVNKVTTQEKKLDAVSRNLFGSPGIDKTQPADVTKPSQVVTAGTTLKDLLQQSKPDGNIFMGQKICSPTAVTSAFQTKSPFTLTNTQPPPNINIFANDKGQHSVKPIQIPIALKENTPKPNDTTLSKVKETGSIFGDNKKEEAKSQAKFPEKKEISFGGFNVGSKGGVLPFSFPQTGLTFGGGKSDSPFAKVEPTGAINPSVESVSPPSSSASTLSVTAAKTEVPTTAASPASIFSAANAAVSSTSPVPTTSESIITSSIFGTPKPLTSEATQPDVTHISKPQVSTSQTPEVTTAAQTEPTSTSTGTIAPTDLTQTTPSTNSTSIFGTAVKDAFGGNNSTTTTTTTSTVPSLFGNQVQTSAGTTAGSFFGSNAGAGLFASANNAVTASVPISTTTTSSTDVFGKQEPPAFGAQSTPSVSPSNLFASAVAQSTTSNIFGSSGTPTTAAANVFGGSFSTAATTTTTSIFGAVATPSAGSLFGNAAQTTSASGNIFGQAVAENKNVFGATQTTGSIFGASPATTSTQNIFGGASSATSSPSNIFGGASATTTASSNIFGNNQQTNTSGNIFGSSANANSIGGLFGSASISTTTAQPPSNTGNIFGGGGFGSKPGFGSQSGFGESAKGSNIFGSSGGAVNPWNGGGTASSAGFGSGFGSPTSQPGSVFGGTGGAFSQGTPGPFSSPNQTGSVFGSPQQQTSFGGGATFGAKSAFGGSPNFGSSAGFGAFSGAGQGNIAQTGFGSFQKQASGFGSGASFGSPPTFGGGSTFGSTSPGKMFGSASPGSGFGTPTQQSSTFEALATQNTLTFGNLAQQSTPPQQQQQQQQSGFNKSPAFTGWRG